MTDHHCIAPPRELVEQWASETYYDERDWLYELHIADRAAQWGADQELEACCADLRTIYGIQMSEWLRSMRRPKPPSLKEQALQALDAAVKMADDVPPEGICSDQADIIRRALEALPDD